MVWGVGKRLLGATFSLLAFGVDATSVLQAMSTWSERESGMGLVMVMTLENNLHFAFGVVESRALRPVEREFATSMAPDVFG